MLHINADPRAGCRINPRQQKTGQFQRTAKGYTWNHAGKPGSTTMELVETEIHRLVHHQGPAAPARAAIGKPATALKKPVAPKTPPPKRPTMGIKARVVGPLNVVGTITDITEMADYKPSVAGYEGQVVSGAIIFEDATGKFTIDIPLLWGPYYKVYQRTGTRVTITRAEVDRIVGEHRRRFGWFRWKWSEFQYEWVPGDERKEPPQSNWERDSSGRLYPRDSPPRIGSDA